MSTAAVAAPYAVASHARSAVATPQASLPQLSSTAVRAASILQDQPRCSLCDMVPRMDTAGKRWQRMLALQDVASASWRSEASITSLRVWVYVYVCYFVT